MEMNNIIVNLLLRKPFFGYILSAISTEKSEGVDRMKLIPGAVVRLLYNPEWLDSLNAQHAAGAVLHELMHLILLHNFRRDRREPAIWAMACDMAANEHISPEMLPGDYLTVETAARLLAFKFEKVQTAEYYYDRLLEAEPPGSFPFSFRDNDVVISFPDEQEIRLTLNEESDLSEINRNAVQNRLENIIREASEEGEIPGSLSKVIQGLYRSVEANWRNVLKQFLTGKGSMRVHKTFKRVSKRFEDLPGNKRYKGIEALAAIDESGSISNEDILNFYRELRQIKQAVKADIKLVRFDTTCTKPVPLHSFLKREERIKNGGTDFRPVFETADSISARFVMIFTDGDGTMPETVKQKVLWVLTNKPVKNPPFGDTVLFRT